MLSILFFQIIFAKAELSILNTLPNTAFELFQSRNMLGIENPAILKPLRSRVPFAPPLLGTAILSYPDSPRV